MSHYLSSCYWHHSHLGFCCISNSWCQGSVPILLSMYKDFGVCLFILLVLKLSCSNWHGWKSLDVEVLVTQKSFSFAAMLLCSRATTCWVEGSNTLAAWTIWTPCLVSPGIKKESEGWSVEAHCSLCNSCGSFLAFIFYVFVLPLLAWSSFLLKK